MLDLKIFSTGGTIDKVYFDAKSDYQVGDPQAQGLLQRANVSLQFEVQSIMRKDSLELNDQDREMIREHVLAEACQHIVITHGTDTMIKTAKALQAVKDKTIVLTGSMYPAQFRDSDAVFNMGCAVTAAQTLPAGVYITMNGKVFDPSSSRKNVEMNRFESSS